MVGFERLYQDGSLAVVHGCGYEHPSLSHFSSMGFWHTGVPNGGESLGWLGRLADETLDAKQRNLIVNRHIPVAGRAQPPALAAGVRRPGTLPARRQRYGEAGARRTEPERSTSNATLDFLASTAHNATESSDFVRRASSSYRTPVDYGQGGGLGGNLQRVAALIAAEMPTRLYYVTYQGNNFDTHVQQADLHSRLLMYTADAVRGFIDDVTRLGAATTSR